MSQQQIYQDSLFQTQSVVQIWGSILQPSMMIYGIVYDKKTAPHMALIRGAVHINQNLTSSRRLWSAVSSFRVIPLRPEYISILQ